MAKIDFITHYKKFQRFDGSLRGYCNTRRPKLNYESTKKTFQKIKKGEYGGKKKAIKDSPKIPRNERKNTPKRKQPKKLKQVSPSRVLPPSQTEEPFFTRNAKTISIKHQMVVDDYFRCRNRIEAYLSVYKRCTYRAAERLVKKVFRRPEVMEYIEYQRSIAISKTQVDLQKLVNSHKEVAFYDLDQDVKMDLSSLDSNGEGELPTETKKYLRNTRVKYIAVKNGNSGGEDLERVIEYDIGLKYSQGEIQNARKELHKILIDKTNDSTTNSTNEQVQQWWVEFLKPPNGGPRLSALGFAQRLESINYAVPPIIEAQAKAELAVLRERSLLVQQDSIDVDEGTSTADLVKLLVREAAKNGDRSQLIDLAKTMAAMKITDKKFNFNMFAELAEMVGSEDEIGWEG